ncbi:MAG: hypothetical protein R3E12_04925 [Candidatus Eisenbacteria bacterium]|uniref:DUF255 domain-containing protein n=1 Tax=Eiseniibacteriota bacterium TaxID=2212470 RepID=A0A956RPU2_UNCEI|nr:hypothetical protein [Candidatus Eisenbacteria bacterium]
MKTFVLVRWTLLAVWGALVVSCGPSAETGDGSSTRETAQANPASAGPVLPWQPNDYATALAEARTRNVPIFVEAWAPW